MSDLTSRRSASVVLRAKGIVNGVLKQAVKDKLIAENPCEGLELPRKPKRKERRIYLTIPKLVAFADECANAINIGDERRARVLLLGFCGLRWGEGVRPARGGRELGEKVSANMPQHRLGQRQARL